MYDLHGLSPYEGFTRRPESSRYDEGVRAVGRACADYVRLCFSAWVRRLLASLMRRPTELLDLQVEKRHWTIQGAHAGGLQTVDLRRVVGSENRAHDFDAAFGPVSATTKDRWVSIAAARQTGIPLPPVELIQVGDRYFVRDGHHRISVARWLGEQFIEAEVTIWEVRQELASAPCRGDHHEVAGRLAPIL